MDTKKDILWINLVRAICIIGVFFVHSERFSGVYFKYVELFIRPFLVNAFFFISGYLLFRKQLSEPIIKKGFIEYLLIDGKQFLGNIFCRLFIPTLLFSLIEFFPSYILRGREFGIEEFIYKTIGGCTYWFTAALIVAELIMFLLLLSRQRRILFYLVTSCIFCALGMYLNKNNIGQFSGMPDFPWAYQNGMAATLFLALGGLYWRLEDYINKFHNKYILALMTMGYIGILLLYPTKFHVLVSVMKLNLPGICISILSIIILVGLCKQINHSKLFNYIGQNTIGLYFMSGALPVVFSIIGNHFLSAGSTIGVVFVFICSMCVSYLVVRLINHLAPWLLDIRKLRSNK